MSAAGTGTLKRPIERNLSAGKGQRIYLITYEGGELIMYKSIYEGESVQETIVRLF